MTQQYDSKMDESREFLESVPAEKLTDGQHMALALHRIGDLIEEYIEAVVAYDSDPDDSDDDDEPDQD